MKMRDLVYKMHTKKNIPFKKVQITSTLINKLQQFKLYIVFTQVNNLSIHYNTML